MQSKPLPLARAMTPAESAAKASRTKKFVKMPDTRCGVAAALQLREMQLEAEGQETAASKKRRKKQDESANDKAQTLKLVKGSHLLK